MRGFFIAIDGIDGCGKTTQINKLADYLTGLNVPFRLTKEPGGTELGAILRKILISKDYHLEPETELLLYSADRLEHQKKVILPHLEMNYAVISDRFISSTYAYQIFGRGLDLKILDFLKDISVFVYPSLTIIIDVEPEIALSRAKERLKKENLMSAEGKFESLNLEFYNRVREGFLWYRDNFENVVIVDGNRAIDELFDEIKSYVNGFLDAVWV